jgi:serine/threonine-protein kinase
MRVVGIGDVIADKFKIERLLGRGGMGYVMAARHETLGHQVAIKVLVPALCQREEAVARFLREARAAASLLSEHVARVLDVGTLDDGASFMVMELLEGRDLAREIDEGVLSVRDTVDYTLQACEALAEAHTLGIVHRDLKPANLFKECRPDGSVLIKVLDFGISNIVPTEPNESADARWTDTKALIGSPQYMSPEQVRDPKTVDPRSDVWSLGVILFELLTGATPFASDNTLSVLAGVVADEPPPIRAVRDDVSLGLEQVILRCLDKRPSARYPSVVELAEALAVYTPTGRAAVERISAVVRSAEERAPADRRGHGLRASYPPPEANRVSPIDVATLESAQPRKFMPASQGATSGGWSRRQQSLASPMRRRVALLVGAAGVLVALFSNEFVARSRKGTQSAAASPASAPSCEAPKGIPATVAAHTVAVANAGMDPDTLAIPTPQATSLPAVMVANRPAPRSILAGAKDSATKPTADGTAAPQRSSAFGPPTLDAPADPLEGRQ